MFHPFGCQCSSASFKRDYFAALACPIATLERAGKATSRTRLESASLAEFASAQVRDWRNRSSKASPARQRRVARTALAPRERTGTLAIAAPAGHAVGQNVPVPWNVPFAAWQVV